MFEYGREHGSRAICDITKSRFHFGESAVGKIRLDTLFSGSSPPKSEKASKQIVNTANT